jgi:hypothetical protein
MIIRFVRVQPFETTHRRTILLDDLAQEMLEYVFARYGRLVRIIVVCLAVIIVIDFKLMRRDATRFIWEEKGVSVGLSLDHISLHASTYFPLFEIRCLSPTNVKL